MGGGYGGGGSAMAGGVTFLTPRRPQYTHRYGDSGCSQRLPHRVHRQRYTPYPRYSRHFSMLFSAVRPMM